MLEPLQQVSQSLRQALEAQVSDAIGEAISLAPFAGTKNVPDETLKLAARSAQGQALGIVLCAPEIAPGLIARGCARGRAAREALGPELGAGVVVARAEGLCEGRSWALFPQAVPLRAGLAGSFERRWLGGALTRWLYAVAVRTRSPADDATRERFDSALAHAGGERALEGAVRGAARSSRARLASGVWRPCHVLMHGDLWGGNVLRAPGAAPWSRRFRVIDWDTSRTQGYPLLDLVRAAPGFRLSRARLGREIARHCAVLECSREDARGALAAAFGQIGLAREHFPLERYAEVCRNTLATFDAAVR